MNEKYRKSEKCGSRILNLAIVAALMLGSLSFLGSAAGASEHLNVGNDVGTESTATDTQNDTTQPMYLGRSVIRGYVNYTNRDANGKLPQYGASMDLRFAKVDIYRFDSPNIETYVGTTDTDEQGRFYYEFTPYPSGVTNQYFVRVNSENKYAKIQDSGVYTIDSDIKPVPEDTTVHMTFSIYFDQPAWNILDSVTEAAEWVKARTGGWTRSKIDVFYPKGRSEFKPTLDRINIATGAGWRDYIVYHEYGHAIMYKLYSNKVPDYVPDHDFRREHTLTNTVAEGWAQFFEHAVGGGSFNDPFWDSTYTKGRYPLEYGLLSPKPEPYRPYSLPEFRDKNNNLLSQAYPFGDAIRYSHNEPYDNDDNGHPDYDNNGNGIIDYDLIEGNFAGILWDIFDDEFTYDDFWYPGTIYDPYDDDGLALGFGPIWDVMRFRTPHTIYEFWDGWFTNYGTGDSYSARTTANSRHWIKAIYFNHGIDPASSNIASAYRLPQNAPLVTDFQITSTGPYNDNKWIDYKLKLSDEPEDQNFLRVRLEYLDTATNKWVQFHEVENKNMPIVDGYYTYNVHVNALGDGTWTVRAVVDDGYPTCQRRLFSLEDSYIPG